MGEGMDSGDKATNKAMSAAQKYAFFQVFCIPTEEPKDSELDSHSLLPKTAKTEPKRAVVTPAAMPPAPITEAQRKRMFAIARSANWVPDDVKAWLAPKGFTSTTALSWNVYDELCKFMEANRKTVTAPTATTETVSHVQ